MTFLFARKFQKAATGHGPFSGTRTAIERCAIREIAVKIAAEPSIPDDVRRKLLAPPSLNSQRK